MRSCIIHASPPKINTMQNDLENSISHFFDFFHTTIEIVLDMGYIAKCFSVFLHSSFLILNCKKLLDHLSVTGELFASLCCFTAFCGY